MDANELYILIENSNLNQDILVGFPYLDGQFYSHEEDNEIADVNQTWLVIDLGSKTDTTTAQEQFLNSLPAVIEYTIR